MGGGVSISRTSAEEKKKAAAKGKDQRRKNSFAFHMTKYLRNDEKDIPYLHRLCKAERDAALLKLQKNNRDASTCLYRTIVYTMRCYAAIMYSAWLLYCHCIHTC